MSIKQIIKSVLGQVILLLFVISITPRHYLHTWLADHEDIEVGHVHTGEAAVGVAGYLCDAHDQVVESPYTILIEQPFVNAPLLLPTATTQHFITHVRLQVPIAIDLRGPPSLA